MNNAQIITTKKGFVGPTFSLVNRLKRALWNIVWLICARFSPPQLHIWRIFLLKLFGARITWKVYVYPDVKIWAPWNLQMDDYATLARKVECYNVAKVSIGYKSVVSQNAYLYTATHDYNDPDFLLYARDIVISKRSWICAGAFVGPGVVVGEGAILGACGVAMHGLESWTIYRGNPAQVYKPRKVLLEN